MSKTTANPTPEATTDSATGGTAPRTASASYAVKKWDEVSFDAREGAPKLARAHVEQVYTGDLEGESVVEYLMVYREDALVDFVAYERFAGRLCGREGTFVLEHRGIYEQGVAKAKMTVVPGSATGALVGLRGEARLAAGHQEQHPITFEYDLG